MKRNIDDMTLQEFTDTLIGNSSVGVAYVQSTVTGVVVAVAWGEEDAAKLKVFIEDNARGSDGRTLKRTIDGRANYLRDAIKVLDVAFKKEPK